MNRIHLATLLLPLLAVGIGHAAPVPESARPGTSFPGGVVDAAGKRAFVTNATGGIDALDLESGKLLWSVTTAYKPLALTGDRLVALAVEPNKGNAVRVVVLDAAREGKEILRTEPIALPDWVVVTGPSRPALGRSFASYEVLAGTDLYVRWQARAWYAGGARPTREIEEAARKNAEGVLKVDLTTGKSELLGLDHLPPGPKVPPEVEKEAARPTPESLGRDKGVTVLEDRAVAVDVEGEKLVLKRWDLASGKALEPITLRQGDAGLPWQADAAAGVVVVAGRAEGGKGPFVWRVLSLRDGKETATVAGVEQAGAPTVRGGRAFFVVNAGRGTGRPMPFTTDRVLRAFDLATGKMLWEHPVEPQRTLPPPP